MSCRTLLPLFVTPVNHKLVARRFRSSAILAVYEPSGAVCVAADAPRHKGFYWAGGTGEPW